MKAIGGFVSVAVVAIAMFAGITWATDSCTVYMGKHNANLSMQGWGSRATCNQIERSGGNQVDTAIAILTLGSVDFRAREGPPSGQVICDGWSQTIHWTVRDYGVFDILGNVTCGQLGAKTGTSSGTPPEPNLATPAPNIAALAPTPSLYSPAQPPASQPSETYSAPPTIAGSPPVVASTCSLSVTGKAAAITIAGPTVTDSTCASLQQYLHHNTWSVTSPPPSGLPPQTSSTFVCWVPSSLIPAGTQGEVTDNGIFSTATGQNACTDLQAASSQ